MGHLSPQRFASAGPWQSRERRPRKPPLALAVAACSAGTFLRVGPARRSWGGSRCRARPSTRMLIVGPAPSSSALFQEDVVLALLLTGPEAAGGEGQRGAGRALARTAGAQRGEAPIPGTCSQEFFFFFLSFFRKKADDLWRVLSKKPKRTSCLPQGFVPAAAPLLAPLRAVVLRPRRARSGLLRRALAAGFLVVVCCVFFFFPLEEG